MIVQNEMKDWTSFKKRTLGVDISRHEHNSCDLSYQQKLRVTEDLVRLKCTLPNTSMSFFESSQSGLGTNTSDVDLVFHLDNDETTRRFDNVSYQARDTNNTTGFVIQQYLRKARVHVISLLHTKTQIEVDITFDAPSARRTAALKNTQLIRAYVSRNVAIRRLHLITKLIFDFKGFKPLFSAKVGGLSSYAHSIIVIYFL